MGNCIYCGDKVGFFRSKHKECKNKHLEGKATISNIIRDSYLNNMTNNEDLSKFDETINIIAKESFIDENLKKSLLITGVENSIENAFDDGLLSEDEEKNIVNIIDFYNITQDELNKKGYFTKLKQGSILRNVMEGIMPEGINIQGQLPFNFQKNEKLIWIEQNVKYLETKNKTRYVGGSQGVSIRVAKGLYYRVGSFKGQRIQEEETNHVDTGLIAITNKHIYFGGSSKNFRIPYSKIVSFIPYSNGIGIQKDGVTAKPQTFVNGDSWFVYNLITNINNLD